MSNAIQQLLEKFLALTNEEQGILFNAMVASRSGVRINDMGMAFNDDIRFRDGIVCPYCGSKGKGVYKRGQTKGGKQRKLPQRKKESCGSSLRPMIALVVVMICLCEMQCL